MRKSFFLFLMSFGVWGVVQAQSNVVTGTVTDAGGKPVRYVFVHGSDATKATFTDSLGHFALSVKPGIKIEFRKGGYTDTVVAQGKPGTEMAITLRGVGTAGQGKVMKAEVELSTKPVISGAEDRDMSTLADGSSISGIAHQKEQIKGNRYMFDDFVPGYILTTNNKIIFNSRYRFDYDKIGGGLLLTSDNKNVTQIPDQQIKQFALFGSGDKLVTFEKVPQIDNTHYMVVLASGPKYGIYKSIVARLEKADYENNGISSHGNDYDQFVDDIYYYVVDIKSGQYNKLKLRNKSLKEAFKGDIDKLNSFMSSHSGRINDSYLEQLGAVMNQ